jgi:hypothetical protein
MGSHIMLEAPAAGSAEAVRIAVRVSLPHLSLPSAHVIDSLARSRGAFLLSDEVAQTAGLRSRHHLSYVLRRDGLPQFSLLAGWMRILIWLHECEREKLSLCRITLLEAKDPAYRYRLVKRLTGLEWRALRHRGLEWALALFLESCAMPGQTARRALIRESE